MLNNSDSMEITVINCLCLISKKGTNVVTMSESELDFMVRSGLEEGKGAGEGGENQ